MFWTADIREIVPDLKHEACEEFRIMVRADLSIEYELAVYQLDVMNAYLIYFGSQHRVISVKNNKDQNCWDWCVSKVEELGVVSTTPNLFM